MPTPPRGRQAQFNDRFMRSNNAKFAQITPSLLRKYLDDAARGRFDDFAELCDRMVREDSDIRAAYETRISAVAGTRYVVEAPEGASELDQQFARFCRDVLHNLSPQPGEWESLDDTSLAMRLLDGLRPGFAVVEYDWQPVTEPRGELQVNDEVPRTFWWIHQSRFEWNRSWRLGLKDDGSQIRSDPEPLDPNKYLVHVPQSVVGYPTQTGTFHAVAWPFAFKRWGQQWWMDGMERFAWPIPYVTVPRETTDAVREAYQEMLDSMTQGMGGVFDEGVAVELLESGVKDGASWQRYIEFWNKAISKALLGNTDSTEPGKVGAWKAVESRTGSTVHPRMSLDAQGLASTYRTQLFAALRRFNPRFALAALPTIRWMVSAERREIPLHFIQAGAVTVNELRASVMLPPLAAGGDRIATLEQAQALGAGSPAPAEPPAATPTPPEAPQSPLGAQMAQRVGP